MNASTTFNGYIGSHLAYHLFHEGIFDLVDKIKSPSKLSKREAEITPYQDKLINFSEKFGIFYRSENGLELTQYGASLKQNVGFFVWMVGGYGEFFLNHASHRKIVMPILFPLVDGDEVALGSRLANKAFMWEIILGELKQLNPSKVTDLGCGSGGALLDISAEMPSVRGIGIDISAEAIETGVRNAALAGVADRIRLYCYNVLEVLSDGIEKIDFKDVDTVMSFMMLHDLFNIEKPEVVLRKIADTFPRAKKFLFADTFLSDCSLAQQDTQIFSYGFEFVHHFMNINLFHKEDYERAFISEGYHIEKIIYLNVPYTYLFILARP